MKTNFRAISGMTLGVLSAILFVSPVARASYFTNYGNFSATTVNYNQVTESSITESIPLYRDPIVSGNSLVFNPHLFGAFATGAGGNDLTDGQLSLTIKANANAIIPTIKFWERGDFTLVGAGTASTFVDVTANFFITVLGIDGITLGSPIVFPAGTMGFSPVASGTFDLPTNPGLGNLWLGVFYFDVNAALTGMGVGYANGATEIRFTLDNELYAQSESGTTARILKKEVAGSVGLEVLVPEPSILTLTLCGAGLLFARRRSLR